jgi:hypothetical protein
MSKKYPTEAEIKNSCDQIEAGIRNKFARDLPPDQVESAIAELIERLPVLFYTAFILGIPSECCNNALEILILDILRARLKITLPKPAEPGAKFTQEIRDVVLFVLNKGKP